MKDPLKTKPEQSSATGVITQRERRLFFALDDDADGLISKRSVTDALRTSGLDDRDGRLAPFFRQLAENSEELLTLASLQ